MRTQVQWMLAGLVCLGVSIPLVLGEVILHLLPSGEARASAGQVREPGLMERVQEPYGWRPRGDVSQPRRSPDGEPFLLRTNRLGMRGVDIHPTPSPEGRRILFLGDSFTMGTEVAEEQTFVGHVGRILQQQVSRPVEIINAGVNGYGTYNEFLYYELHARSLRPQIVVVGLYTGSDFRDNMVMTAFGSQVDPLHVARPFAHTDPAAPPPRLIGAGDTWLPDPISGRPVPRPSWGTAAFADGATDRLTSGSAAGALVRRSVAYRPGSSLRLLRDRFHAGAR